MTAATPKSSRDSGVAPVGPKRPTCHPAEILMSFIAESISQELTMLRVTAITGTSSPTNGMSHTSSLTAEMHTELELWQNLKKSPRLRKLLSQQKQLPLDLRTRVITWLTPYVYPKRF